MLSEEKGGMVIFLMLVVAVLATIIAYTLIIIDLVQTGHFAFEAGFAWLSFAIILFLFAYLAEKAIQRHTAIRPSKSRGYRLLTLGMGGLALFLYLGCLNGIVQLVLQQYYESAQYLRIARESAVFADEGAKGQRPLRELAGLQSDGSIIYCPETESLEWSRTQKPLETTLKEKRTFLVGIRIARNEVRVGTYQSGQPALKVMDTVRVVSWPQGDYYGEHVLEGGEPPETKWGYDAGRGSRPNLGNLKKE